MSIRRKLTIAVLAAGMLVCGDAQAAITHVTHNLNLRSGPDTSYHPMAIIPAGATIDVLACGTVWCHIHWASHLGYVNGYYLKSHVTVLVAPLTHVHHVIAEPVVYHTVIHHHVVKPCRYLFC